LVGKGTSTGVLAAVPFPVGDASRIELRE